MKQKIIVTGGAGFIGSNVVEALNKKGIEDIIIVDHLNHHHKVENLKKLRYSNYFDRGEFLPFLKTLGVKKIDAVIHLGACANTQEADKNFLIQNNTIYSNILFEFCLANNCQFIYASSAATYGDGSQGYNDDERNLKPLNNYGYSKHLFDQWVLDSSEKPRQWVGLKFFNVYGPNEYHKGSMASVILHGFEQIQKDKEIKLFKSYHEDYPDGGQLRDFVYVKDVTKVILFFLDNPNKSGIFNVGTGKARSFIDLAKGVFAALGLNPNIHFIDMPPGLKERYQYFTEANMNKLREIGYREKFYELEEGIKDYVQNYLLKNDSSRILVKPQLSINEEGLFQAP
ncbi:ADP-glyceromanno-heptose 6-epimerase [Candidatus Parcubacteria bacterium]|nr:MAG: ADP-glyceromanno-heptose 6-epimerase [Candidatus Parcubacteria bacterium]